MSEQKATRAKVGGEVGMNGFFYAGGQFLPTTSLPPMTKSDKKAAAYISRKQEIAPYTWECPPSADVRSLYSALAGTVARRNWETDELEYAANETILAHFNTTEAQARARIDAYNSGVRWETK
jgi:hypothetical protein